MDGSLDVGTLWDIKVAVHLVSILNITFYLFYKASNVYLILMNLNGFHALAVKLFYNFIYAREMFTCVDQLQSLNFRKGFRPFREVL